MEDLMNKKNIGAMLSVIAAVTAGASAYATTIDNLDQDQHTNSLITEANYTESYSDYDLVKSEYTEDVKNTKIAKEAKPVKEEKIDEKSNLDKLVENAARDAVVEITATKEVEASEEAPAEKDTEDKKEKAEAKEESKEELKEEASEEKTEEADKEEEKDLAVVKYVNTEILNVRSTKDMDENNIVSSLKAGDEVKGILEDGFLNTEIGYINEDFLSDVYPVDLVNELNKKEEAKKAEEAKQAEEAKKAEEARQAEEAKKAEEERQAQEARSYYYTGWVNTSVLNVRSSAGDGSIIGSVRKGDWLEGEASNGWLEIDYNGQKGYVSADFLSDTEVAKEEVKEEVAEANEQVQEVEEVQEAEQASAPAYSGSGLSAADLATQFVGSPYVWGSANPGVGFDCSGLTSYVYSQMGISIPHQSAAQYSSGYAVDSSNLQAGDLVFFSYGGGGIDHVGIVVNSDGTFVHASTPATGVRYDNVYNGSFQNAFVGARRIY